MVSIEVKSVSKSFERASYALKDVSFKLDSKEFLVILGPSGCGKTTLLRCIAGLEEVSSGKVLIDGVDITKLPPKNRNISMVFQDYALYPSMNVYKNMEFALKGKYDNTWIRNTIVQTAKLLGIDDLLNRKIETLSGGQKQRVALGRAMVRSPKIFLLDEPFSSLDAQTRVKTRLEFLRLYNSVDSTFICVTHDQEEAMVLATTVVVMDYGVVQQIGSPIEIYNNPANIYVAKFIGTPQINLFICMVSEENNVIYLQSECFKLKLTLKKHEIFFKTHPNIKKVYLGIRGEYVYLSDASGQLDMEGIVSTTVTMGREAITYIKINNDTITSITNSSQTYPQNTVVKFTIDENHILLFDVESELKIDV